MISWQGEVPEDVRRHWDSGSSRLIFHGYYRLLGRDGTAPYSLDAWNELECWKFAWGSIANPFFCFAFSAWGDQYALDMRAPASGVFLLHAYDLRPEPVARSLTELLEGEIARIDRQPYDARTLDAFDRWGALRWDEGLALVPPLLIATSEDACQVVKTNMRSLMIMNGDVYSQVEELPEGAEVSRLDTYVDEEGRERLRLITPQ